ncbi:MAG: cysteine synthase A [Myxococcales bacterium]|nr:cysteine synthase A [Myxococcales bacterium]
MTIVDSLLGLVGETSLLKLSRVAPAGGATVWVKLEQQNPGGSVKDRIAVSMLEAALRDGRVARGGTVIEPTSGNTGIALAMACAANGLRAVLTMPESMSLERRALLEALGAKVVLTPEAEQLDGAVARAEALARETPGAFLPRQFANPANPEAHRLGTGRELVEALDRIDAFVAGVGTGGTVTGVGRALRDAGRNTRVIAVEPAASPTLSTGARGPTKIQGLAAGFVPDNYDPGVVDAVMTVGDDEAWQMKTRLAREEGLLVGISAGANVVAALRVAERLGPEAVVVTVLCDTGERYFSLREHFGEAVA